MKIIKETSIKEGQGKKDLISAVETLQFLIEDHGRLVNFTAQLFNILSVAISYNNPIDEIKQVLKNNFPEIQKYANDYNIRFDSRLNKL